MEPGTTWRAGSLASSPEKHLLMKAAPGFSVGTPNRLWSVRMPWISQPRGVGTGRAPRSGSRSRSCSARGSGTRRPSA